MCTCDLTAWRTAGNGGECQMRAWCREMKEGRLSAALCVTEFPNYTPSVLLQFCAFFIYIFCRGVIFTYTYPDGSNLVLVKSESRASPLGFTLLLLVCFSTSYLCVVVAFHSKFVIYLFKFISKVLQLSKALVEVFITVCTTISCSCHVLNQTNDWWSLLMRLLHNLKKCCGLIHLAML